MRERTTRFYPDDILPNDSRQRLRTDPVSLGVCMDVLISPITRIVNKSLIMAVFNDP